MVRFLNFQNPKNQVSLVFLVFLIFWIFYKFCFSLINHHYFDPVSFSYRLSNSACSSLYVYRVNFKKIEKFKQFGIKYPWVSPLNPCKPSLDHKIGPEVLSDGRQCYVDALGEIDSFTAVIGYSFMPKQGSIIDRSSIDHRYIIDRPSIDHR